HINQQYSRVPGNAGWIGEGIPDYVRHKYFEKDIESKLRLGSDGLLHGYSPQAPFFYGLEQGKVRLDKRGYRFAYTVAGAFLYWLEQQKNQHIVRTLNLALSRGDYSGKLFSRDCGATLDSLWGEFMRQSALTH